MYLLPFQNFKKNPNKLINVIPQIYLAWIFNAIKEYNLNFDY